MRCVAGSSLCCSKMSNKVSRARTGGSRAPLDRRLNLPLYISTRRRRRVSLLLLSLFYRDHDGGTKFVIENDGANSNDDDDDVTLTLPTTSIQPKGRAHDLRWRKTRPRRDASSTDRSQRLAPVKTSTRDLCAHEFGLAATATVAAAAPSLPPVQLLGL